MGDAAYLAYDDFVAPRAKSFGEYTRNEKKNILKRSVYNKNFEALERIRQHYHGQGEHAETLFTDVVLYYATVTGYASILNWLRKKYPNVESWTGEGIWQALLPFNSCGVWLCEHASVQELVLRNVGVYSLKYYNLIPRMQGICRTPALEAAIFRVAMVSRSYKVVARIAANNTRLFVRDLCVANQGEMLRRAGKNKRMARVLLRAGVSRSDYASVGLAWPLT
jgi:hypothetical protein